MSANFSLSDVQHVETVTLNQPEGGTATPETSPPSTNNPVITLLDISVITRRDTHCYREQRNEANVEGLRIAYLENKRAEERGEKPLHNIPLPKVWCDPDNGEYVLLGGDHRTEGATRARYTQISVLVYHCSADEAYMIGVQDNATHGEPLSKGDKRYTIEKMLRRFPLKSYREIARAIPCALSYVSEIANKMIQAGLLEGKKKKSDNPQTANQQGTDKKPSASQTVPRAKGVPVKSLAERKAYTYEHLENLIDDMPEQEGADFLEEFIKRCEYMYNYRAGIAKSNNVPQATDQSAKAT